MRPATNFTARRIALFMGCLLWAGLATGACANGSASQKDDGDPKPRDHGAGMISLELTPAEPGTPGTHMKAILKNTGSTPLLVNTRLGVSRPQRGGELFLRVVDESGQEVPFSARVNIGAPTASHFEQLAPGQAVERSFDLALYFPLRDRSGTVEVAGTYSSHHAGPSGQQAWQGEVQSAPVSLTLP